MTEQSSAAANKLISDRTKRALQRLNRALKIAAGIAVKPLPQPGQDGKPKKPEKPDRRADASALGNREQQQQR